jgi:hypothetical protein
MVSSIKQRHREHEIRVSIALILPVATPAPLVQRQRDRAPRVKQRQLIEERPFVGRGSSSGRLAVNRRNSNCRCQLFAEHRCCRIAIWGQQDLELLVGAT